MIFSSMVFLWIFLPIVILVNFMLTLLPFRQEGARVRAKNIFLLFASLFFYAWGGPYYLLIMLSTVIIDFAGGYAIQERAKTGKERKLYLCITLTLNLGILFFFKYFNMVIDTIEVIIYSGERKASLLRDILELKGTGALGIAEIALPIGVSFFTFQAMSYVIDVYRGMPAQKNILDFTLYVSLFPQLVAGPIVQYNDIAGQLNSRKESVDLFVSGQQRFCIGLAKKVIIANTMAETADAIWALEVSSLGAGTAWLGVVTYTLQIYYDFSGYSDMAIGIGRMLGFRFKENFDFPYMALSMKEFWRRWHISLTSWFREYVYIPLGGNRKSECCTYRNIFIVFLLTGIWHGANFTFIIWGLMHAALQILERLFLGKFLDRNPVKLFNKIYVLFFVMIGWVYFRSDNVLIANEFIGQLFAFGGSEYNVLAFFSMKLLLVMIAAVLGAGGLHKLYKPFLDRQGENMAVQAAGFVFQMILLVYSMILIVSGSYNPFIYFQF